LCHLITPYRISNGVNLCLYYLGGKYNYIITAANAVVNPVAQFPAHIAGIFPIFITSNGPYAAISNPSNTKMLPRSGKNLRPKIWGNFQYCLKKAISYEITILICR